MLRIIDSIARDRNVEKEALFHRHRAGDGLGRPQALQR
jgi:hypothetical protein